MPTLEDLIREQVERGRDPARARRRAVRLLAKLNREAEENARALERGQPFRTYTS
jgi:NTP pyrophosphatase (non-canonical NTP hydrolase)